MLWPTRSTGCSGAKCRAGRPDRRGNPGTSSCRAAPFGEAVAAPIGRDHVASRARSASTRNWNDADTSIQPCSRNKLGRDRASPQTPQVIAQAADVGKDGLARFHVGGDDNSPPAYPADQERKTWRLFARRTQGPVPRARNGTSPTARRVIGSVVIANKASIWFNVVIRGDNDLITIGERSNVQDGSVLHADPGFPLDARPQRLGRPQGDAARLHRRRRQPDRHQQRRPEPRDHRQGLDRRRERARRRGQDDSRRRADPRLAGQDRPRADAGRDCGDPRDCRRLRGARAAVQGRAESSELPEGAR